MKLLRLPALSLAASLVALPAFAQASLELKRVLLSTGGVGYFELEATVEGDAELALAVRLDQVDDVLKSIVVYDDKGGVGSIQLPGREPLSEVFRDLPFDQDALGSAEALLNALRGAELTVGGPRQVSGRILKVEPETIKLPNDGGTITKHRITLMAADGMRQVVLEDAESVKFADPKIQQQVDTALAAIARHRVQDQRTLTIMTRGKDKRTLRVGYVVAAPLWKSSYRLRVPDSGAEGKGLLQGWAVVENLSGRDWSKVELTLVSGNPVTFRQQLYNAYYVHRPEVPVEVLGRVLPPPDQGTIGTAEAKVEDRGRAMLERGPAALAAPPSPPPASMPRAALGGYAAPAPAPVPLPGQAELFAAEAQEATTQVLFTAPAPISVKAGETLALPIVAKEVPIKRVALYQPQVNAANPLAAVRVTNETGSGLPPGVLTLYERGKSGAASYVGDARLAPLPAGEDRLLSFAVDQKVQVEREVKSRESIAQAKIARGVLTLSITDEQTTLYRVKAPANEDRMLLIEQPRVGGWELVSPKPGEVELTRGHYRIARPLAKAGTTTVEVVTQRPRQNVVQIAGLNHQALLGYARQGSIPGPVRQALERIAGMQAEVDRLDRQVKEAASQRETIAKDQERLRQNLASVPAGSDLAKRYLATMKTQEDRIDLLRRTEDDTRHKLLQAREALADAIAKLEV
ncbi:MAG: DUF4139 domain-containing protein [Alphaproteobacteria bacterium]|nr:DUF4139 domain-containing protein [Alphaproteobacteria bacterium]